MTKIVIYNHGKDSTPWGEKTMAFVEATKHHGYEFESPDYTKKPDPDERVNQLLTLGLTGYRKVVFIGSSMGAYVATIAAESLTNAAGLFLLAPAFYLTGYSRTDFKPLPKTWVFHGWQDDVVPPENAWLFCQRYRTRLLMLNSDHRLIDHLPLLVEEFEKFLIHIENQ